MAEPPGGTKRGSALSVPPPENLDLHKSGQRAPAFGSVQSRSQGTMVFWPRAAQAATPISPSPPWIRAEPTPIPSVAARRSASKPIHFVLGARCRWKLRSELMKLSPRADDV